MLDIEDRKFLGNKIRSLRIKNNLTQGEFAEKAKITRPLISSIEVGRRYPTDETIEKISKALEKKKEEIYDDDLRQFYLQKFHNFLDDASTEDLVKIYRKVINLKAGGYKNLR